MNNMIFKVFGFVVVMFFVNVSSVQADWVCVSTNVDDPSFNAYVQDSLNAVPPDGGEFNLDMSAKGGKAEASIVNATETQQALVQGRDPAVSLRYSIDFSELLSMNLSSHKGTELLNAGSPQQFSIEVIGNAEAIVDNSVSFPNLGAGKVSITCAQ